MTPCPTERLSGNSATAVPSGQDTASVPRGVQTASERVVVCGAGAAGMAAAISAARAGKNVCLVEAAPQPGGTVARALIHTLGGLYDSAGELLNAGLAAELAARLFAADPSVRRRRMGRAWVLAVCPEVYRQVTQAWVESEPRISPHYETRVEHVAVAGHCVREVLVRGPDGEKRLPASAVIDATGTAEIVRLVDPALLQDDATRAAGGLIFSLRGVQPGTLAFPRGLGIVRMLREAADGGELPAACARAWLDAGIADDEVYVKLFVPLADRACAAERREAILRDAIAEQAAVTAFLRRLPEFASAKLHRRGELGVRDGGRIRGEYCLTADDVRQSRRFADAACRCCWPIEYWDPQEGVSVEYLPDGSYYEIPLRALKVAGVCNLWAAGKCLSADRRAHASARVAGTCWSMGEAAGRAAAEVGSSLQVART